LNEQQRRKVISDFSALAGQKFSGIVAPSSADAAGAWASIASALTDAHWAVVPPLGDAIGSPPAGISIFPDPGVTVALPLGEETQLSPTVLRLVATLNSFGIAAFARIDNGPQKMSGTIKIEIGPRP
jgi:hypothetical protein